jgi:hypothetical protein
MLAQFVTHFCHFGKANPVKGANKILEKRKARGEKIFLKPTFRTHFESSGQRASWQAYCFQAENTN